MGDTKRFHVSFSALNRGREFRFSIAEDEMDVFLGNLEKMIGSLEARGFQVLGDDLEDGESLVSVSAYVASETSTGEPCLHMYSNNMALQYRVLTLYMDMYGVNQFAVLPFPEELNPWDFDANDWKEWVNPWPGGAAPDRAVAMRKGVLVELPTAYQAVLRDTGKTTDDGKPIRRFARWYGVSSQASRSEGKPGNEGSHESASELPAGGDSATEKQRKLINSIGSKVWRDRWDEVRHGLAKEILRRESTADMSKDEASVFIDALKEAALESLAIAAYGQDWEKKLQEILAAAYKKAKVNDLSDLSTKGYFFLVESLMNRANVEPPIPPVLNMAKGNKQDELDDVDNLFDDEIPF